MPDRLNVTVYDGKYTVIQDERGGIRALRYGLEWRDCTGDGLVLALAQEVEELRLRVASLEAVTPWQPIGTAVHNSRLLVLVYAPPRHGLPEMYSLCQWHPSAGFCIDELRDPTHWMPVLPPEEAAP